MNINFELYKIFYYVAKNESISRAANELSISQPAISKSIKNLEEQIGTNLFIRKRDGVILSEAGNLIYKKIKSAVELIDSAEDDIVSLTNMTSGTINIAASKTIISNYLMPFIKKFHNQYPKIKIKIYTDRTNEAIKKAQNGLIDVVFTNYPDDAPNDFESIKLMEIHDIFVATDKYGYLKNKKLTMNDLSNKPLLLLTKGASTRINLDNYCTENNIKLNPEMEFSSYNLIRDFTKEGFGIGMVTKEFLTDELSRGELFELNVEHNMPVKSIGLMYSKDRKNNVILKASFVLSV